MNPPASPLTRFVLAKGREGLGRAATQRYWREQHGPLVTGFPEFWDYAESYVQNHTLDIDTPDMYRPEHDGVLQIALRDTGARRFSDTPVYRERVQPDEVAFSDPRRSILLEARSYVVVDGPRQGIKVFSFFRRNPAASQEEFEGHWLGVQGALLQKATDAGAPFHRCVQYCVAPGSERCADGSPTPYGFDGILEIWIPRPEDIGLLCQSDGYQRLFAHNEESFLLYGKPLSLFLNELTWSAPAYARR